MMASSDDEYLAPVIKLFGDRSGTKQRDATANVSSSEESSRFRLRSDTPERNSSDNKPDGDSGRLPGGEISAAAVNGGAVAASGVDGPMADAPENASLSEAAPVLAMHTQTQSKMERRLARDGFSEISRVSMRALARRGMSSHEMAQFLGTREFDVQEIDGELERLEGSGLLDDAALAETLARTLRDRKGLGAAAISAELRRRKIDHEHISAVLDVERDDEQERATEIALKRAPQLRSLDSITAKRRLTGFLMRKGYSGSVVSAAVAAALTSGSHESSSGPTFR